MLERWIAGGQARERFGEIFFFAAALGLGLALTGCGERGPRRGHALPVPPSVAKCKPGQAGGRLVMTVAMSPQTFNPLSASDGPSDFITRLLNGSLVNLNYESQEPEPGLAETWTNSTDGKTWTFKLRAGLRWSDGVPLTADDVVFTWNDVMFNPQYNQVTYELFQIGGKRFEVSKVDDLTVKVVTPDVFAPFVEFFGVALILPRHILQAAARENRFPRMYGLHTSPERLVGCGPFRLKEQRDGQYTLLERNPEYWVADTQGRRLPYLDQVLVLAASHTGSPPVQTPPEVTLFLDGKSDLLENLRIDSCALLQGAKGQKQSHSMAWSLAHWLSPASSWRPFRLLDLGVGTEREILWFNQNTRANAEHVPFVNPVKLNWFRDRRFRQAVSCAIDRERLVREAYYGRAEPMYGFVSEENKRWCNPSVARFSYDPARARSLLAEMGLANRQNDGVLADAEGHRVEITFTSNIDNRFRGTAARLIQEDLLKIGVKLLYQPVEFQDLARKVNSTFDYECAMMGLAGGGLDPATQMNVLRSSDELHQWFPAQKSPSTPWEARLDQLMEAQMRTLDFAARKKCFDEAQAILAEEQPMICTVSPHVYAAARADLGNLAPSVLAQFPLTWNLDQIWVPQ